MGYLFENMEKMDIQEERRKAVQARKDAEEAENRAKEARSHAEEAESRAEEAESRAEKAENRAKEAEKQVEETRSEAMRNIVLLCQRFGRTKEDTVQELMIAYGITQAVAQEEVEQYWKNE